MRSRAASRPLTSRAPTPACVGRCAISAQKRRSTSASEQGSSGQVAAERARYSSTVRRASSHCSKPRLKSCSGCTRGASLGSEPSAVGESARTTSSTRILLVITERSVKPLGMWPDQGCGVQPGGGTTLHIPYGSICGMIDWKYRPGSLNSAAVGRKTGHSGRSVASLAMAQCRQFWP